MKKVIKSPWHPLYSIFIPFTRYWCVKPFLESFDRMTLARSDSELVFFNDTHDEQLQNVLTAWLEEHKAEFNGATIYQSGHQLPNEFDVSYRRQRICDMKNLSKELMADSTYTFCLEDDTLAPPQSFTKLLEHIAGNDEVVVASGIEVGRWSLPVIGAWKIDPIIEPTKISSVPYREGGTQFVDGVGWYCYITYTSLYKQAHYHYEGESLGPDVVYAWEQRKNGHKVLVDWTLTCAHMINDVERLVPTIDGVTEAVWHRREGNNWEIENKPVVLKRGIVKA